VRVRTHDEHGHWSVWEISDVLRAAALRAGAFSYSGNWQRVRQDPFSVFVRRSQQSGAKTTLRFNGTAIGAVLATGDGQGIVRACVDLGTSLRECRDIDLDGRARDYRQRVVVAFNDLAPGPHRLSLKVLEGPVDIVGAVVLRLG
jgi:hypothetical protein